MYVCVEMISAKKSFSENTAMTAYFVNDFLDQIRSSSLSITIHHTAVPTLCMHRRFDSLIHSKNMREALEQNKAEHVPNFTHNLKR